MTVVQAQKKASPLQVARAVFWSFLGIRKRRDYEADSVELKPLSDTLARLVPQARDFSIGMVEKEVILVDPGTRQVVAVVTQEPANAVH